ncbi:MAG: lipid A deacylase LpxR family protein [Pseudomonadota bacterium]|nr:lipid A deacylase LpxR family protein [Pseudomonadota bacterium]
MTLSCASLCAVASAHADEPRHDEAERSAFTLLFENDLFFHTDRDYTNGVLAAYTTAPDDTPAWAVDAARSLPFFAANGRVRTSYALGQNMYTPTNIALRNPPLNERPYAGYLYGALGLIAENDSRLDQLQLQLGVVGPASLAEQTQKFVHKIVHATHPEGWDTQLGNEPGIVLIYERSWRAVVSGKLLGFSFDIDPHAGGAVGNVYDYVNMGAMARIGFDLPDDYGPMRIDPGLPGSNFYEPESGFGWYIFAGADGRAIGHNIFLDGNSFTRSRSVAKLPLVGDLQFGLAISLARVRIAFTHVFRTKEYHTQPGVDQFGAVSVSFRF